MFFCALTILKMHKVSASKLFTKNCIKNFLLAFSCTTFNDQQGDCISFLECDYLMRVLTNSANITQTRNFLQQFQCQKSPKNLFCCPKSSNLNSRVNSVTLKLPRASEGVCGRSFDKIRLPNRIVGGEKVLFNVFFKFKYL